MKFKQFNVTPSLLLHTNYDNSFLLEDDIWKKKISLLHVNINTGMSAFLSVSSHIWLNIFLFVWISRIYPHTFHSAVLGVGILFSSLPHSASSIAEQEHWCLWCRHHPLLFPIRWKSKKKQIVKQNLNSLLPLLLPSRSLSLTSMLMLNLTVSSYWVSAFLNIYYLSGLIEGTSFKLAL